MREEPVPLTEVLMALSLHDGKGIMRALRLGAAVTCHRRHRAGSAVYVLRGRVAAHTVTTTEHRGLGPALVMELSARLEPHLGGRRG